MALSITTRPSGFNAVHLPIMYKLTSTLWPTNSVDTVRTVSSFADDNGYAKLTLSGDLKTGVQTLEWVKVTVNGEEGVYQIYNVFSDSIVTIDLEYVGTLTFGNVQYYYSNYFASVKIYAGLRASHVLNGDKPNLLQTTIKGVPDSNGVITLNINEILKSDIGILENDFTELTTLPQDLEQFTEFYIEYAENYDQSVDGYTLSTYQSSYTSDAANYAISTNSKLPFKNGYGGVMTGYYGASQKFLTMFTTPTIFEGFYYDLFFLRNAPNTFTQLRRRLYSGTTLLATVYDTIDSLDEGVYRLQIQKASTEDSILVDLWSGSATSEEKTLNISTDCYNQSIYLTWRNYLGGMDYWLFTAEKDYGIDIESTLTSEKNIFVNWPDSYDTDKIRFETDRQASETVVVRSQNLTLNDIEGLKYIKTSTLVQEVTGTENAPIFRTVLVDNQSFRIRSDRDKLYYMEFTITYTDMIPSQSL
jgi:hypothetical protein